MAQWKGTSKTNTLGYRIFVFFLKTFGIRAAYALLFFVVGYYFLFSHQSSKHILAFYRTRFGYSRFASLRLLYRNYLMLGQTLIDKMCVMADLPVAFTIEYDGEDALRDIVAMKKGGLLLSAHAGNWAMAGQLLRRLETRIHVVMFDGEHEDIKRYLESVSGKTSYHTISIKEDLSHIYQINAALKANEIVCMHGDRYLPGNRTLMHSFLGEEAPFPEGPFLLALRLNTPVAFVFSFKEARLHYHFYATPPHFYAKERGDTAQTILRDFVTHCERMVKKYPEQWFNYYDFWKKS